MWIIFASLTVLSTTVLGIAFRRIALKTSHPREYAFIYNAVMFLLALPLAFILGVGLFSITTELLVLLILSGVLYGIFQRYQFTVRKHIEASVIQTIVTPAGLVGYLLAVVWLGEAVTLPRTLGYGLVLVAAYLVTRPSEHSIHLNKYALFAFVIASCLSVAGVIDRAVSPNFESAFTYLTILLFFHAFICFLPAVKIATVEKEFALHTWRLPLLASINIFALWCLVSALQRAPATQVLPVVASNVVLLSVVGIWFLKERTDIFRKLLSSFIVLVGLILVAQ